MTMSQIDTSAVKLLPGEKRLNTKKIWKEQQPTTFFCSFLFIFFIA